MLPIIPGNTPVPVTSATRSPGSLRDQIPSIQMPMSFAYDLQGGPIILDYPIFTARIWQKGQVLVNLGNTFPLTAVVNGSIPLTAPTQAENAFTTLVSNNKVEFNPETRVIKFSNTLITPANNIDGPRTEIGMEISSTSSMPIFKIALSYPELSGSIGQDRYVTFNYSIEVEVELKVQNQTLQPAPIPVAPRITSPVRVPRTGPSPEAILLAGAPTVGFVLFVAFTGGSGSAATPAYAKGMAVILVGATATTIAVQN